MADLTQKDLIFLLLIATKFGVKVSHWTQNRERIVLVKTWRDIFYIEGLLISTIKA